MAAAETATRSYRFGAFELDLDRGVLENAGQVVGVRAKTFALLSYFAANPNRVITKDEVTRAVWNRSVVTDDSIAQIVRDIRRVLGDASEGLLRTVPKRGFIFAEGLRSLQGACTPGADVPSPAQRSLTRQHRGGRAAVAVLPFRIGGDHMSGDAVAARDALLRDMVRDLSRLRLFFIVTANPAMAVEPLDVDPVQAGRNLAVDYVACGSLAASGPRFFADVQLIETATGRVLFAERFERVMQNRPGTDAEMSGQVVRALAREMDLAERNRSVRATELDSWTAYYRGQWHMHRVTAPGNLAATTLFAEAIELDPTFSRPYAGLSFAHWTMARVAGPRQRGEDVRRALVFARQALAADPLDPAAYCAFGRALWLDGEPGEGREVMRKAASLGLNHDFGRYALGLIEELSGEATHDIPAADLSPFDPFAAPMMAARSAGDTRLVCTSQPGARAGAKPHLVPLCAFGSAVAQLAGEDVPGGGGGLFLRAMRFRPQEDEASREFARS